MKINWGTGIVIAFVCFISFIMYFVITMNTDRKYDHDLVTEDYYEQELEFQNDINKETNAKTLEENITWKKTTKVLLLHFQKIRYENITGKVFLYRPSNKQFDFEMPISLSNHNLLIPDKRLLDGRWNIKVDWQYKEKTISIKKKLFTNMLWSALIFGLLGSFHCVGMCGPIAFMLPVDRSNSLKKLLKFSLIILDDY